MQRFGIIINGELILSENMLPGYKPIDYGKVTTENYTEYIIRQEVIEFDDYIYIGEEMIGE